MSAMHNTNLSADLWEKIAEVCAETHELRTVYNVAQDLSSLQSVCKISSRCALSFWPSVAQRCHPTLIQLAENAFDADAVLRYFKKLTGQGVVIKGFKPETAGILCPEIRTIYIQAKIDKATLICPSRATWQYHLTESDLQTCQDSDTVSQHSDTVSQDSGSASQDSGVPKKRGKRQKDGKRKKDQIPDCPARKRIYQQVCQGDKSFAYGCASKYSVIGMPTGCR